MMKTIKILFAVFFLQLLMFTSCEKEEPEPDYVGTWVCTGTTTIEGVTLGMKDIMTFSSNTFTDIIQIKYPNTNQWIDFIGLKGSISVIDKIMNFTITEIGMSTFDMITGMPTGNIVYYIEGQSEFIDLLTQSEMNKTFNAEYSISGNQMSIKTDNNGDGDYDDENEIIIYTKQS